MKNQKMQTQMLEESKDFVRNFKDDPKNITTWGHNYFCSEDGALLSYDNKRPKHHQCPVCQKEYTDAKYDRVWVYMYRNEALVTVYKLAILYQELKDPQLLEDIYKIVDFYADNYLEFKLHNKNDESFADLASMEWGCGRLMPQGLNESIAFSRMLLGLQVIKDDLDPERLSKWKTKLFDEIVNLLKPQIDKIHNIACWNLSIIGSIAYFYGDEQLIDYIQNSEFNIHEQMKNGITSDGFWFEGSIHYNYFTLESFVNLLYFMHENNQVDDNLLETIKTMSISAYQYAFDNHMLPNPNDGWPNINLKTYSYIYGLVAYICEDEQINYIYNEICKNTNPRGALPLSEPYYLDEVSIEEYYFTNLIDLSKEVVVTHDAINFAQSNFAMIKDDKTNVFLKYGHNGPSHAHPDKMTIEMVYDNHTITSDLSNTGYGVNLCNEWHRMTPSHNTVVINGENHVSTRRGEVTEFSDNHVKATASNIQTGEKVIRVKQLKQRLNPDEVLKDLIASLNITEDEAKELVASDVDEINHPMPIENQVDISRELTVKDNIVNDIFIVNCDEVTTIDYFIHSPYQIKYDFELCDGHLGFDQNGYQHLMDIEKVRTDLAEIDVHWYSEDHNFTTTIDLSGVEMFVCKSYDNPVTAHRTTIILRKEAEQAEFKINWKLEEKK